MVNKATKGAATECAGGSVSAKSVAVGDVIDRVQANQLPVWSRIVRVDGANGPYATLTKMVDGLWLGDSPSRHIGGIGIADWRVERVGEAA